MSRFGPNYYDPMGRRITMQQWATGFGYERHVGLTVLRLRGHRYRVSTVWLGLDHSFFGGPPLIFETMIFAEEGTMDDLYQERYSTGQQAIRGHMRAVRWLKRNVREQFSTPLFHNGHKPVGRPTPRK